LLDAVIGQSGGEILFNLLRASMAVEASNNRTGGIGDARYGDAKRKAPG
jgi:hypothetical protein